MERLNDCNFAWSRPARQEQHWKAKCKLASAIRSLGFLNNWVWARNLYGFGLRYWAGWKSRPWAILLTHVLGPKWAWVIQARTLASPWFVFGFSRTNQGTRKVAVTHTTQRAYFGMIPEINKCISQKAHCVWPPLLAAIIACCFTNRGAYVSFLWYS